MRDSLEPKQKLGTLYVKKSATLSECFPLSFSLDILIVLTFWVCHKVWFEELYL